MPVHFHNEEVSFSFNNKREVSLWLKSVVSSFQKELGVINVVFCNDQYLLKINQTYLNHDYFTDIITFNYNENNLISGDLFISIDRVKENAINQKMEFNVEIHRVIVHGVLHLCGLNDQSKQEKEIMRGRENLFLQKLSFLSY